jgi:CubicO group peptidase (beta-lactamase class C family)
MKPYTSFCAAATAALLLIPSCTIQSGESLEDDVGSSESIAAFTWGYATPESQGMDPARLEAMRDDLMAHNTSRLLVIRNDNIVLSVGSLTSKHMTASMAKALVGGVSTAIVLNDELLPAGLNTLVKNYVPQWAGDPQKSWITVRHLGSHTSGLEDADQGDPGWESTFWNNRSSDEPFILSRDVCPLQFTPPGSGNQYSNPGIAMLSFPLTAVIQGGPHTNIRTLLRERVMRPIGIPDTEWSCGYGTPPNIVSGLPLVGAWGGGDYSPNATARVARLMLKKGLWEGTRLISEAAVTSVVSDAGTPGAGGIGWWSCSDRSRCSTLPSDAFFAIGSEHQIVVVVPSLDVIAVRNGGWLTDGSPAELDPAMAEHFFDPLMESIRDPYPASPVITRITWAAPGTIVRKAIGSDGWPLTWADDGPLYGAYGDGNGFEPQLPTRISLGFGKVSGLSPGFVGTNIHPSTGEQPLGEGPIGKKASGMLMVGGTLYMWTRNADGNGRQSQLAWSTDHARTWTWSPWQFAEFGYPTFLNYGKDYAGARDNGEYVYVYSHDNPSAYDPADRFILMRVPSGQIRERAAYRFFTGLDASGNPLWTPNIAERGAVFAKARGCRRSGITYDAALGRYLWWHQDTSRDDTRNEGGLAIYDAPEPWGPWTTVYKTAQWDVGPGETASFPTKWMSEDGKTIHLVFSGQDCFSVRKATLSTQPSLVSDLVVVSGEPYQWFNLASGQNMYIDRTYRFGSPTPASINGQFTLRTANDDKFSSANATHVSFTVNQPSTVYVLYTTVNTTLESTWLTSANGWSLENYTVPTTLPGAEAARRVRKKTFAAGAPVTLGGNGSTNSLSSMYNVVVVP